MTDTIEKQRVVFVSDDTLSGLLGQHLPFRVRVLASNLRFPAPDAFCKELLVIDDTRREPCGDGRLVSVYKRSKMLKRMNNDGQPWKRRRS